MKHLSQYTIYNALDKYKMVQGFNVVLFPSCIISPFHIQTFWISFIVALLLWNWCCAGHAANVLSKRRCNCCFDDSSHGWENMLMIFHLQSICFWILTITDVLPKRWSSIHTLQLEFTILFLWRFQILCLILLCSASFVWFHSLLLPFSVGRMLPELHLVFTACR